MRPTMATAVLIGVLVVLPALAWGQSPPCDPTFTSCVSRCEVSGWGIQITVHAGDFACFKFYRKHCGDNEWTLIYEGPDNSICDCEYDPSGHQKYLVERYWDEESGACSDLSDSCESMWQPSACPP